MTDNAGQCYLHCVTIRAMSEAEKRAFNSLIAATEAAFQQFITNDAEL